MLFISFFDAILFTKGMSDQIMLRYDIVFHLTCSMIGILWEVFVTRAIVLLLSVMTLHMVRWVVYRVFIVVNSCVLIEIIVASIAHWVVKVKQVGIHALVSPL